MQPNRQQLEVMAFVNNNKRLDHIGRYGQQMEHH